jgi:cbb3-type cytochrome oxidase subunit 1
MMRVAEFPSTISAEKEAGTPILAFLVMSVTHLFIGTVQGVLQTLPGVSQWLRAAGQAGHLIDPLAHAHINLVGGVTMGMMGLFYYVLPRVLGRRSTARSWATPRSGSRRWAWRSSSARWCCSG